MLVYVPWAMFFAALTLIDDFNVYATIPGVLGAALLLMASYSRTQTLRAPLWMAKQVSIYATVSIFLFLMLGYGIIFRHKELTEKHNTIHRF